MFRALCAHLQEVKLYYTVSVIVTPVGDRPVHRLRDDSRLQSLLSTCAPDGHLKV